ncbi:hypothetical protein [Methylobacterium trifolii]|uniref:hypothetical protein n=1 Tax=Methylobacterium trifolii TaxID=1003092 RepID=UPI001EE130E6|nr:hypothetical protein [Methylobacterium trifolii]
MERLDLAKPQFTQAEVLQIIPHLSGKTLQNWKSRGLINSGDTSGKGNRHLYSALGIVMLNFMDKITRIGISPALARSVSNRVAECAVELWNLQIDHVRADGMREIAVFADGNDTYRRGFLYNYEIGHSFIVSRQDPIGSLSPRIFVVVAVDLINIAVLNMINRRLAGIKPAQGHIVSTFADEDWPNNDPRNELIISKIKTLPVGLEY